MDVLFSNGEFELTPLGCIRVLVQTPIKDLFLPSIDDSANRKDVAWDCFYIDGE